MRSVAVMKSSHLPATSAENSSQMQLSPSESCDEYDVIINYSPKPRNLNGVLLLAFFDQLQDLFTWMFT